MKNKITIDYDNESDVLYLSFGNPKPTISEEFDNIAIRKDEITNEIIGVTVINFLKNFRKNHKPINIKN